MRVCIVGGADSRLDAPFEDRSFEIWGINNCYRDLPRVDRMFEIHPIFTDGKIWYRRGLAEFRGVTVDQYLKELDDLNVPVYVQQPIPLIRKSIAFPLEYILREFNRRYFTCSVSYMMALAINLRVEEIGIYGVNMATNEYHQQRPGAEYWIGRAEGLGVKVSIPETSSLLHDPLYGFDEMTPSRLEYAKVQALGQIKQEGVTNGRSENGRG